MTINELVRGTAKSWKELGIDKEKTSLYCHGLHSGCMAFATRVSSDENDFSSSIWELEWQDIENIIYEIYEGV